MHRRSRNSVAAGLVTVACMGGALAACGQKGPLTLPKTTSAAATPAAAAASASASSPVPR